jgi:lipoprotein NlpI
MLAVVTPCGAAQKEPQCGEVSGNPELAIRACTRVIEFGSLPRRELAQAYYIRGTEWAQQGNHDRAVADFGVAIDLEPKLAGAYFNRALSWSEKGDSDRAIADYEATIKLTPTNVRAFMGRAVEWVVKGDYKRALADYEEIIRLEPQSVMGHFGRGRVRFYAGDFAGAASDFIRAQQTEPTIYTALWLYLARKRAGIAGEKTLAQEAGTTGAGDWPAPIVGLYLGSTSPDAVQKAAAHANPTRQRDQRCEASFYVAQWHMLRGARDAAAPLLREARTACPSSFIEHEGAVAELRRLETR